MSSPYKVKYKPTKKPSNTLKFLGLLSLFAAIVAGFIYAFIIRETPSSQTTAQKSPYPPIHMEDLGKTPGELKKKYPNLLLTNDRKGRPVAKLKMDGAHYFIWFIAENGEKLAFRIKANKTYKTLEENDVLSHFGSLFGRPFDGQCDGKTSYAMDKCHFKWWVREMVSLDLHSRFTSKGNVILSAITTDTYLSTKHHKSIKRVLPVQ